MSDVGDDAPESSDAEFKAAEVTEHDEILAKRLKLDTNCCPLSSARKDGSSGLDCGERKLAKFVTSAGNDVDEGLDATLEAEYDKEVDDLLEANGNDYVNGTRSVLQRAAVDTFNVLPDKWIEITHNSGLPVYLHRETRACTFGRPYFIGAGSARSHKVPKSAIPCYYQRHLAEEESKRLSAEDKHFDELSGATEDDPGLSIKSKLAAPFAKIQDSVDNQNSNLTPEQLHEYAAQAFAFRTVSFRRYNDWRDTREYFKELKKNNESQSNVSLVLPPDTQLITLPPMNPNGREVIINPKDKTAIAVLYEFAQKGLKSAVSFDIYNTQDALNPYSAIAKIPSTQVSSAFIEASMLRERLAVLSQKIKARLTQEGRVDELSKMENVTVVGQGHGSSKKGAKSAAATAALSIFIPELKFNNTGCGVVNLLKKDKELEVFDLLDIADTRIIALSQKTGQLLPYAILQECLSKCHPFMDAETSLETKQISATKTEAVLHVGENVVTVHGSTAIEAKQFAAQQMLKIIYPQYEKYGSILRLYGFQEKQEQKEPQGVQKIFQKQSGGIPFTQDNKDKPGHEMFLKTIANHMAQFQARGNRVTSLASASFALPSRDPDVPPDSMADAASQAVSQHGDPFFKDVPKI